MIDIEKKIAEHTLKKLHKKSWNTLTLDDVIEKKNKKQKFIKSKTDLLKNLNRYVDMILIDKTKNLENSSTKDMLFEVLMARFDILQENRIAFIKIFLIDLISFIMRLIFKSLPKVSGEILESNRISDA